MSFWQKLLGSDQPQHKDPGLLLPELLKNYRAENRAPVIQPCLEIHCARSRGQVGPPKK